MSSEFTDLQISIPQAAKLLGIRRESAWSYAKRGLFGPVRVINRRGKMQVSIAELRRRYSLDRDKIREITK